MARLERTARLLDTRFRLPLIGDLFDIAFKSHTRNLALLQADMQRKRPRASQQEPAHA